MKIDTKIFKGIITLLPNEIIKEYKTAKQKYELATKLITALQPLERRRK